jgi:exodeoxyribonuclease VII small subunit
MPKKAAEKDEAGTRSFEDSMERLELLVNEMEGGKLGLEEMMVRFEEGRKLIFECSRRLNEVERRIEMLVAGGDGNQTVPFKDADSGAAQT